MAVETFGDHKSSQSVEELFYILDASDIRCRDLIIATVNL